MTTPTKPFSAYFDEDGRQLKPLPAAWIQLSRRFKLGDRIRCTHHQLIYIGPRPAPSGLIPPELFRDLAGQIGTALSVHDGHRIYPDQQWSEEHECWVTDSTGWLTVRFPFDVYGVEADGVTAKPRACRAEVEGEEWELVSGKAGTP